ncbi:hypothetical protein RRG08_053824, partial [Elysia crispata]
LVPLLTPDDAAAKPANLQLVPLLTPGDGSKTASPLAILRASAPHTW